MRSKNFTISLYPENEKDILTLEYIKNNYNYAYIIHNKDTDDDGVVKKEHIHTIIMFENAKEMKTVAKELNIEQNRIEKIKSLKYMIRYLIHLDQPEKAQYDIKEIKTNLKDIAKYFKTQSFEQQEMLKILEYIYSIDSYIYYYQVLEYVLNNNYYSTYRRAGTQITKIIDEHNKLFLYKKKSKKLEEDYIKGEIYNWELENTAKN